MPRFAVLEHTGAPDDPAGRHFDLLIEAGESCRTWRLAKLPEPGGPPVAATELPPHRLAWLDHEAGEVSGGRGFARRVDAGTWRSVTADAVDVATSSHLALQCVGNVLDGRMEISRCAAAWQVALAGDASHASQ
jgi:hypothetical protein